jgi:hypothetical protein
MEIQHTAPVLAEKANFVIGATITSNSWRPEYTSEQLAAEDLGNGTFRVCNTPFALYDICVDDIVELDDSLNIKGVVKQGDYTGFRIVTSNSSQQEKLIKTLDNFGILYEIFNSKLLAVAVRKAEAEKLAGTLLKIEENEGIEFETIKT